MKSYVSPIVSFESFELSSSYASGCEYKTGHAKGDCAYYVPGEGNIFLDDMQNCEINPPGGQFGKICYHVPTGSNNIFTS